MLEEISMNLTENSSVVTNRHSGTSEKSTPPIIAVGTHFHARHGAIMIYHCMVKVEGQV